MTTKVNYIAVGTFVIMLSIVSVVMMIWLLGNTDNKNYKTYLVYIHESVSGLNIKAPVKYNGVEVGYVDSINLDPKDLQTVRLTLEIEEDIPVTVATYATLMAQGITGLAYVNLKAERTQAPLLHAKPNEKYPVIKSKPSLMVELDTLLREVSDSIRNFAQNSSKFFSEENYELMKKNLEHISTFTAVLEKNAQNVNAIVHNSQAFSKNAATATEQLNITAHNLKMLSEEIRDNPSVIFESHPPQKLGPGEK